MYDTSFNRAHAVAATIITLLQAILFATFTAALLSGCGSVVEKPTEISELPVLAPKIHGAYRIVAGDELEIQFFHTPQLNTTVPVRPDGHISLLLTGDVKAAGKTAEELRETISAVYSRELKDPEVAVIVRSFTPYRVHVGGEVRRPGVFEIQGRLTVLEAIMEAGGRLPTSRMEEVIVIRRSKDGSYVTVPVDLKAVIAGTDPSQNLDLEPYDAVVVPRRGIVNVNIWVDQYVRRNIPISFSANPNNIQ